MAAGGVRPGRGVRGCLAALPLGFVLALGPGPALGAELPDGQGAALPPGFVPDAAAGQELVQQLVQRGMQRLELEELQAIYRELDPSLQQLGADPERVVRSLGQEGVPPPERWLEAFGEMLLRELRLNARLLGQLLALAVLGAMLQQLGRGVAGRAAQEAAASVIVLAVALLAVQSFAAAVRMVQAAVEQMGAVAQALVPTLTALAASTGNVGAAVAVHPLLLGVVSVAAQVVQRVVVPGLLVGGVLGVASSLAPEFPMTRLAALCQRLSLAVLGLCLTTFLGLVAVKGAFGPAADGVSLRALKFVTGATVPVVGRMMAEAVEVVAGASGLLRAGVGAAGLMLVMLAAATPVVKLLAIMLVFSLASALLEPVGERRVQQALGVLGDTLGLLLAALAACAVLFLVAISTTAGILRPWP